MTNLGRVSAKTIHKWHLNLMNKEVITGSLAGFIQGRAPATVEKLRKLPTPNLLNNHKMVIESEYLYIT